jgi:hypothetical protein
MSSTDLCGGPFAMGGNPKGGLPPYHFQLDTAGGFPPIGLILGLNGILSGTPANGTDRPSPYAFRVCAVDLAGSNVCPTANILVLPPPYSGTFRDLGTSTLLAGVIEFYETVTVDITVTLTGTHPYAGTFHFVGTDVETVKTCSPMVVGGCHPRADTSLDEAIPVESGAAGDLEAHGALGNLTIDFVGGVFIGNELTGMLTINAGFDRPLVGMLTLTKKTC